MTEEDENRAIIMDNGSFTLKAGFSNQDAPSSVYRTVCRVPKVQGHPMFRKDNYIIEGLASYKGLKEVYPIQKGYVSLCHSRITKININILTVS